MLNRLQCCLALSGFKHGDRQRKRREPNPDKVIRTAADVDGVLK
jgi:hypothetical protein